MKKLSQEQIKKLEMREEMLIKRCKLSEAEMRQTMIKTSEDIIDIINKKRRIKCIGIYNAINKEINTTFLAEMIISKGLKVALPQVVTKKEPLVFNIWDLTPLLNKDAEGIPFAMGEEVKPDVLIIPLVAYNREGYRIGYGSGYYDRTLNSTLKGCFTIGVGYSFQETSELEPEAHDVPMDVIVTEKEIINIK